MISTPKLSAISAEAKQLQPGKRHCERPRCVHPLLWHGTSLASLGTSSWTWKDAENPWNLGCPIFPYPWVFHLETHIPKYMEISHFRTKRFLIIEESRWFSFTTYHPCRSYEAMTLPPETEIQTAFSACQAAGGKVFDSRFECLSYSV